MSRGCSRHGIQLASRLLDVAGEKLEGVVLMPAATQLGEVRGKIEIEGPPKTDALPVGWIVLSSAGFEFRAEIGADGSFRIPGVGPGIYFFGMSPPAHYYVKSAHAKMSELFGHLR